MINRNPTYDRQHPKYFNVGKPIIRDAHVIYINLDGFARYYLDMFVNKHPNSHLAKLMDEGAFFANLHNAMPSITNPCQNMILSGGTSVVTGNVYRYYDIKNNIVVQQKRENKAILLSKAAVKQGVSCVSVAHFLTEKDLTSTDMTKLYIRSNNELEVVKSRGDVKTNDHFARFEQLYRILRKEEVIVEGKPFVFETLPQLIIFYADDLDGVGHNEVSKYGYPLALSEQQRLENIHHLLHEMDQRIGKLIEICKEEGIYDKLTFFITTDHGMVPFGYDSIDDTKDHGYSKLPELFDAIKEIHPTLKIEFLRPDERAKLETNLVVVGANLNVQLTFLNGISDHELETLKNHLLKKQFVGAVKTRKELDEDGYLRHGCDMVVTPSRRYCFSKTLDKPFMVRAQHDSLLEQANHIPGWIFGKGIKQLGVIPQKAYNYDFGTTMAAALGLVLPDANGLVLDVFEESEINQ